MTKNEEFFKNNDGELKMEDLDDEKKTVTKIIKKKNFNF